MSEPWRESFGDEDEQLPRREYDEETDNYDD